MLVSNLFLIGFKNCGKTTVGRVLAEKMKWRFVDLDEEIEADYQREKGRKISCRALYGEVGEVEYRRRESEALRRVAQGKNQVVATGGGVVTVKENVGVMQEGGVVVYLEMDWKHLWPRFQDEEAPAYVEEDAAEQQLHRHFKIRKPYYEKVANVTIDADEADVEALAEVIKASWYTLQMA